MEFGRIFDILSSIVVVAGVAVVVTNPNIVPILNALTSGFVDSLKAATLK